MHMADALVTPAVAGTMYACSAAGSGVSLYRVCAIRSPAQSAGNPMGRTHRGKWRGEIDVAQIAGRAEYGLLRDDSGWGISGKQTVSAADSRKAGVCVSGFRQPVIYVNCI